MDKIINAIIIWLLLSMLYIQADSNKRIKNLEDTILYDYEIIK